MPGGTRAFDTILEYWVHSTRSPIVNLPEGNIGSLLMLGDGLPLRPDGYPYQVLFLFDNESNLVGPALSEDGQLLVWDFDMGDSGDPADWTAEIAPPEIAAAALQQFEAERI